MSSTIGTWKCQSVHEKKIPPVMVCRVWKEALKTFVQRGMTKHILSGSQRLCWPVRIGLHNIKFKSGCLSISPSPSAMDSFCKSGQHFKLFPVVVGE